MIEVKQMYSTLPTTNQNPNLNVMPKDLKLPKVKPIQSELKEGLVLGHKDTTRIEICIHGYLQSHVDPSEVSLELAQLFEDIIDKHIEWQRKQRVSLLKTYKPTKKEWLKFITTINNLYYAEALITSLEARRRQLKPKFKSETPRG